ncbi:MAG: hypothetical protein Q8L77_14605 [Nitrospirota bacterium]|nr:hypothetical protein [Nitrospirota bacterium]
MSDEPRILSDKEQEELVDRAFIKVFGKTFRPDGQEAPDSLAQIEHDFPSLFGGSEKA